MRGHVGAKEAGIQYIVGCHLQVKAALGVLAPGSPSATPYLSILVYPTDRASYGRLCRLLTLGKRKTVKGQCELTLQDLIDHQEGMLAVALPPPLVTDDLGEMLRRLRQVFDDDRLSLAAACLYDGEDKERLAALAALARSFRIPLVATNDVYYHEPDRKALQDVLTCVRLGVTLDQAGFALQANAERYLKSPDEMARLFREYPHAIARTMEIAKRAAGFSLDQPGP